MVLTPPPSFITDMPREIDATRAPSVVARGMRNSPSAYSPEILTGPA